MIENDGKILAKPGVDMGFFIKILGIPADQTADIVVRFWETYEFSCIQANDASDVVRTVTTSFVFPQNCSPLDRIWQSTATSHG